MGKGCPAFLFLYSVPQNKVTIEQAQPFLEGATSSQE